jgi:hypothetical protein
VGFESRQQARQVEAKVSQRMALIECANPVTLAMRLSKRLLFMAVPQAKNSTTEAEPLISAMEAARRAGKCLKTWRLYTNNGWVPCIHLPNGTIMHRWSHVVAHLEKHYGRNNKIPPAWVDRVSGIGGCQ